MAGLEAGVLLLTPEQQSDVWCSAPVSCAVSTLTGDTERASHTDSRLGTEAKIYF